MALSYQEEHLQGTKQKYEIIKSVLDENDKTLLDVGCNAGLLVKWFNEYGLIAEGVDCNPEYVQEAKRNGVNNIRVFEITPHNIDSIDFHDVILLLSVYHQWQVFGELQAKFMLKMLGGKARKFVFQPPSVRRKYKYPPAIKDNNKRSIIDSNLEFLTNTFPDREVSYIGFSSLSDKQEPCRYLFMVK